MSRILQLLKEALDLSQKEQKNIGNARLAREIGVLINNHFPNKENKDFVAKTLKRTPDDYADKTGIRGKVYDYRNYVSPGKKSDLSQEESPTNIPENVVGTKDPEEALLIQVSKMDDQGLLEHFGSMKAIHNFAKLQGFKIKMNAPEVYLSDFREAVIKLLNTP